MLILTIAPESREYSNGFTLRKECFEFVNKQPDTDKGKYDNLYSLTHEFFLRNAKLDYGVYIVCSAIANYFTLAFPEIDGIIFPSVQGNTGYNIVLRPHVVDDKKIQPKNKVLMKKWNVTSKNQMSLDSEFEKIGLIQGKEIVWNE